MWQSLPSPQKGYSLNSKLSKRTHGMCYRNANVSPRQLKTGGRDELGEQFSSSYEGGHWELDHAPMSVWITHIGFIFLLLLLLLLLPPFYYFSILGEHKGVGRHGSFGRWEWSGCKMWNSERIHKAKLKIKKSKDIIRYCDSGRTLKILTENTATD